MGVQEQIEARYVLVESAYLSRDYCCSQQEWIDNEEVREICTKAGLDLSILDHIAHFVWTFRRK